MLLLAIVTVTLLVLGIKENPKRAFEYFVVIPIMVFVMYRFSMYLSDNHHMTTMWGVLFGK